MIKSIVLALLSGALVSGTGIGAERDGAVRAQFDPDVGWVVLNTTPTGKLIATAHLDHGLPNEEFMINIRVRYEDGMVDENVGVATLYTNAEGKGTVAVEADIHPPAGSSTLRRVAFRARRPGPPNILYVAVAWDVPLK